MTRGFARPAGHVRTRTTFHSRARGVAPLPRWPLRPPGPQPGHRPIRSGRFYRALWPAAFPILVVPELADEISAVLEEFAQAAGATAAGPLKIMFRRGTMGLHRSGRALDIYEVGGKGIGRWAHEWNQAVKKATAAPESDRARIIDEEKTRNLGYKLYKALQAKGGWAQPAGYPVQLFGPWTRVEGPHKAISDRLLKMHNDHIHVAK